MAIQIKTTASISGGGYSLTDITAYAPFSIDAPNGTKSIITIKTTVSGQGTAHVEIYDPTNSIVVQVPSPTVAPQPLTIYDTTASHYRFQGYVQKLGYKVVANYRWIILDAVDLNAIPTTTLVGVPNGEIWEGPDSSGKYVNIDPNAVAYYSDQITIQKLFDSYWVYPYVAVNTDAYGSGGYVQLIKAPLVPAGPDGTTPQFTWDRTTLAQAIADTCTLSGQLTVCWIDQDGYVHLTQQAYSGGAQSEGPLTLLMPQSSAGTPAVYPAPATLSDDVADVSSIPYENFAINYDASGYVISGYVRGASTYINNPTGTAIIGGVTVDVPGVEVMGTGWVNNTQGDYGAQGGPVVSGSWLSAYLDAPQAGDAPTRDAVGTSAVGKARQPLVKGQCDVVEQGYFFAAGMALTITNTPAMLAAVTYMIQTVTTTMMSGDLPKVRQKLEWGTAPNTTLGLRANASLNASPVQKKPPQPWTQWDVQSTGADGTSYSDTQAAVAHPMQAQLLNANGAPWAKQGVPATWWVTIYDALFNDVTAMRDPSFSAVNVTTDAKGGAATVYTTPSSATAQPGDTSYVWISGYPAQAP